MGKAASESVPGIDFEKLTPWFSEHAALVGDPRDESRSFSTTIVGHGAASSTLLIDIGGTREHD